MLKCMEKSYFGLKVTRNKGEVLRGGGKVLEIELIALSGAGTPPRAP